MRLQLSGQWGLQLSEGLTGLGGSPSKLTHVAIGTRLQLLTMWAPP